jgi:hypothetical protein
VNEDIDRLQELLSTDENKGLVSLVHQPTPGRVDAACG